MKKLNASARRTSTERELTLKTMAANIDYYLRTTTMNVYDVVLTYIHYMVNIKLHAISMNNEKLTGTHIKQIPLY